MVQVNKQRDERSVQINTTAVGELVRGSNNAPVAKEAEPGPLNAALSVG